MAGLDECQLGVCGYWGHLDEGPKGTLLWLDYLFLIQRAFHSMHTAGWRTCQSLVSC